MKPKRESIVVRDSDGQEATIVRITPHIQSQSLDGMEWLPGLASLYLDGDSVNALPDGSFQVVGNGKRYWRKE